MGNVYRDIPDDKVHGRRPIDPRRHLRVGGSIKEAIRDDHHVFVQHIGHGLATQLVDDFNRQHYPSICRWMQNNQRKLTGNGISLWMGMIDYINGSVAAQPIGRIPADDPVHDDNLDAMTHTDVDTYGIGQPNRKSTNEWEPDVPDPDVDLMKSIRDACTR